LKAIVAFKLHLKTKKDLYILLLRMEILLKLKTKKLQYYFTLLTKFLKIEFNLEGSPSGLALDEAG